MFFNEDLGVLNGLAGDGVRCLHHVETAIEREQLLRGGISRLGSRRRIESLKAWCLTRIHREWFGSDTRAENSVAADGKNRREKSRAVVSALHRVGHFPGPTGHGNAIELSALPLILLVGVRIEILGQIQRGLIGCLCRGLNESSHIGDERHVFLIVEVALHLRHVGVQAVGGLPARLQWQKLRLGYGENRAGLLVSGVARVHGNQNIVPVVTTKHENAHQRLVIRSALRESADQSEFAETADESGSGGGAAGQPEQVSSCVNVHRALLWS
jgi:hypothetical protein